MKPVPDTEITGSVTRCHVDRDALGAVIVAYSEDENGVIGRAWLRLDSKAVDYVLHRLQMSPPPPTNADESSQKSISRSGG